MVCSTCHLIDTMALFCFWEEIQRHLRAGFKKELRWMRRKSGSCSSRGYWGSGCSVWAGSLHRGAEEGHLSTLYSAPGIRLWQPAIRPFPHFTLCYYPSISQQTSKSSFSVSYTVVDSTITHWLQCTLKPGRLKNQTTELIFACLNDHFMVIIPCLT